MDELIEIGPIQAYPNAITTAAWPLIELNDGAKVEVPLAVVRGAEPGSTLWVITGVHGNEYVGLGALHRLLKSVTPTDLRGTLVIIPMVNVVAYRLRARSASIDGMDMNRIWPGAPLPQAVHLFAHSEIVVSRVIKPILETADFMIDCHDGSDIAICAPYVAFSTGRNEEETQLLRDAAVATGFPIIWEQSADFIAQQQPQTSHLTLTRNGVPAVLLEAGGKGEHESGVQRMYLAIRGIMDFLGMMPAEHEARSEERFWVKEALWLRAEGGGFFSPAVPVLSRVEAGQHLSSITDFFGTTRDEITSPYNAIVMTQRDYGPVNEGEFICELARL
ncbi:MAG: succinylglutamate desuccinylase/aspartoacylase family protein [Ardenticatenaceae bacterium]|nr:succinylglutamate desuccinylase/aspartoacylase family protein [Ardenticatenaceae bacterium]